MVRPASSHSPAPARANPTARLNHGRYRCAELATGATARPKTANTAVKPAVIAAVIMSARATATARLGWSPVTRRVR